MVRSLLRKLFARGGVRVPPPPPPFPDDDARLLFAWRAYAARAIAEANARLLATTAPLVTEAEFTEAVAKRLGLAPPGSLHRERAVAARYAESPGDVRDVAETYLEAEVGVRAGAATGGAP